MTPGLGDAPIEPEFVEKMNALARMLDEFFNGKVERDKRENGFILMVFKFGAVPVQKFVVPVPELSSVLVP